jgi:hypothetical protein
MEIQITEIEEEYSHRLIEYREASLSENERDSSLTACYEVLYELGQRARMQRKRTIIDDDEAESEAEVRSRTQPEGDATLSQARKGTNDVSQLIN